MTIYFKCKYEKNSLVLIYSLLALYFVLVCNARRSPFLCLIVILTFTNCEEEPETWSLGFCIGITSVVPDGPNRKVTWRWYQYDG